MWKNIWQILKNISPILKNIYLYVVRVGREGYVIVVYGHPDPAVRVHAQPHVRRALVVLGPGARGLVPAQDAEHDVGGELEAGQVVVQQPAHRQAGQRIRYCR